MRIAIKEVESQGRISLPKKWRDELGLKPKSKVEMILEGREIVLIPISSGKSLMELKGIMKGKRIKDIGQESELAEIKEALRDLHESSRH